MDIVAILEVLGTVVLGGGLLEAVKWFANRKAEKKAMELENLAKAQEIITQKNGTVDEWEKLSTQHNQDLMYYRESIKEKEELISKKDEIIIDLRNKINDLSSENTALRLTRCEKLACPDRIPPFGYSKIDIRNGLLEACSDDENVM